MELNPHFVEFIDRTSSKLLEIVEEATSDVVGHSPTPQGSLGEKIADDWSDTVDLSSHPMILATTSHSGEATSRWLLTSTNQLGINENKYSELKKFIDSVYKNSSFNQIVSRDFLEHEIFDWLISKFSGDETPLLSDFLKERITGCVKDQIYCFPVLFLDVAAPIKMGGIEIKYFTKADFDSLADRHEKANPDTPENSPEAFRDEYQGMTVVCCRAYGEPERAKEIALEKCLLAVDLLKICSDTLELPDLPLDFDIDVRAKMQTSGRIITHGLGGLDRFNLSWRNLPKRVNIDQRYFIRYEMRHIRVLGNFVFVQTHEDELSKLLLKALKDFSAALSLSDLHQRIASLFTIYESLLLLNIESSILDSLVKYAPKIICEDPEDRTLMKNLLRNLYKVRSAYVHHGSKKEFELEELKHLQCALQVLIINLIGKRAEHKTKESVLNEIEELLNKA